MRGRHSTCKILYRSVQGFLFPRYVILPCFWVTSFLFVFFWGGGSSIRLQPTSLNGFLRKVRRNTSFRVRIKEVPFGGLEQPRARHSRLHHPTEIQNLVNVVRLVTVFAVLKLFSVILVMFRTPYTAY